MDSIRDLCEFLSQVWQCGLAVINLKTLEPIYVSDSFSKTTSIGKREIQSLGFNFYKKYLHPSDYEIIARIHNAFLQYVSKSQGKSPIPLMTYNVRLKNSAGDFQSFSMVLKIVSGSKYSDKDGRLGLVICLPEIRYGFERFFLSLSEPNDTLFFSNSLGKFVRRNSLEFREIEKDILRLIANGNNETKIAKQLQIKIDLVRYYKKCIYHKLYVSNMSEAIYAATIQNLI